MTFDERIQTAKRELGSRVIVLGHHYQRDDVIRHADLQGDSYQLSVMASQTDAEYIVFCGVHFMAESADILGKPHQQVILRRTFQGERLILQGFRLPWRPREGEPRETDDQRNEQRTECSKRGQKSTRSSHGHYSKFRLT